MHKDIRVLMVIPNFIVANGVASFVMNYYRHVDHNKIHMDFVVFNSTIDKIFKDEVYNNGDSIYYLPCFENLNGYIKKCCKIFEHKKYDIIHDNSLINTIPLMRIAKKYDIPVRILHAHATQFGETKLKELRNRVFFPLLDRYTTHRAACSMAAGTALFGGRDFKLIPNVINGNKYYYNPELRNKIRRKLNCENKRIVLSVGRIAIQKNPIFAVDAVAKAIKRNPNIEYWWIGTAPFEKQLRMHIKEIGCADKIKLLGNRTNVENFYMAADCFILPSLFEGLPVVAVEAQTAGLPCLISNTVTSELAFTNLVKFLPIDKGPDIWADLIENYSVERTRREAEFENSIFADINAGENLMNYYYGLLTVKG